jgi:hypothetical protein
MFAKFEDPGFQHVMFVVVVFGNATKVVTKIPSLTRKKSKERMKKTDVSTSTVHTMQSSI